MAVDWRHSGTVRWALLPDARFDAPTFGETLTRAGLAHANLQNTGLDVLCAQTSPQPAGWIFHIGRCGSTLLSRLINQLDTAVCFPEPPSLNTVLGPAWAFAPELKRHAALAGLSATFGRWRPVRGRPHIIKLVSVATLNLPHIVGAFPLVPYVFLYRDPLEVLVSVLARRPHWFDPARNPVAISLLTGVALSRVQALSVAEVAARILARLMTVAADHWTAHSPTNGLLINYEQLPGALTDTVTPHFRLTIPEACRPTMAAALRVHAKDPTGTRPFIPDRAEKHAAATSEIRELVARFLIPPYTRLEELRSGR